MVEYPKAVNVAGWLLVASSVIVTVGSVIAACYILWSASSRGKQATMERLHEVGGAIEFSRGSALAFGLCAVLALAIGCIGYCHTSQFIDRQIIEPGATPNGGPSAAVPNSGASAGPPSVS